MQYIEWLEDLLHRAWKIALTLWSVTYGLFHLLFEPSTAWNAAWGMFLLSFITKIVQLTYEEKSFWKMLKHRFSACVAVKKAAPRVIFYLTLMFGVARSRAIFPEAIRSNFYFVATSLVFTIEFLNSMQHLSVLPGDRKSVV